MDFLSETISREGFKKLMALIEAKQSYLVANGFKQFTAVYEIGDEVGVFIPTPTPHHKVGRIYAHKGQTVDIQLEKSQMKDVSIFQLFRMRPFKPFFLRRRRF